MTYGEPRPTAGVLGSELFLHGMRGAQLARLTTTAHSVSLPDRHRFFEEGTAAEHFWLIRSGSVALDLPVPGRGPMIIETIGRGDVLGWSWLFRPYLWRFGAVGVGSVTAYEFDALLVRTLCAADPELGYDLIRRFSEVMLDRLQATRLRLLELGSRPGGSERPSARTE